MALLQRWEQENYKTSVKDISTQEYKQKNLSKQPLNKSLISIQKKKRLKCFVKPI